MHVDIEKIFERDAPKQVANSKPPRALLRELLDDVRIINPEIVTENGATATSKPIEKIAQHTTHESELLELIPSSIRSLLSQTLLDRHTELNTAFFKSILALYKEELIPLLESLLPKGEVFRHPHYQPTTFDDFIYWINMVRVRQFFQETFTLQTLSDVESLMAFFSTAHEIATTGIEREKGERESVTIYKGMSDIQESEPGKYRHQYRYKPVIVSGINVLTREELIRWLQITGSSIDLNKPGLNALSSKRVSSDLLPVIQVRESSIRIVYADDIERLLSEVAFSLGLLEIVPGVTEEQKVKLIASVIQFWASSHPFRKVNHSLIMNLLNYLLKKNGLSAVPCTRSLWPIAVSLQDGFQQYFWQYYQQHNLDSECWKQAYDPKLHGENTDFEKILVPVH